MKKWLVIGIVVIALSLAGGIFYLKKEPQETMAQTPTAAVEKGTLEVRVSGSGSIEPVNSEDLMVDEVKEVDEVLVSLNDEVSEGQELITFTDGSDSITAPFSGTITALDVEEGDNVTPEKVVAHLTDYKSLQTVISVDELDVSKVKVGQTASIIANAYPEEDFSGKVTDIAREGTYENGVSTFSVTITIDQPKSLKVGMSVEASILVESKENALLLPIEAVRKQGDRKYVFVPQESEDAVTTVRKEVKTGLANESYIEITEGLEEGEIVQLPAITTSSQQQGRNENMFMPGGMMPGGGMQGGGMMRRDQGGTNR
jgi:multidrug efflux pump subunit AcrA (membrane-fusion protein)